MLLEGVSVSTEIWMDTLLKPVSVRQVTIELKNILPRITLYSKFRLEVNWTGKFQMGKHPKKRKMSHNPTVKRKYVTDMEKYKWTTAGIDE